MPTLHRRPLLRAFLLAPLAALIAGCLLFAVVDLPKGASQSPLALLVLIMPFWVIPTYLAVFAVGAPTYWLLRYLGRLEPGYFALIYAVVGAVIPVLIPHRQGLVGPFVIVCALMGVAAGWTFGWCIEPVTEAHDAA